jgi:hypothetical protein
VDKIPGISTARAFALSSTLEGDCHRCVDKTRVDERMPPEVEIEQDSLMNELLSPEERRDRLIDMFIQGN